MKDEKPFVERVHPGESSSVSRPRNGGSSIDHLSHFDDLSLVNYPDGAGSMTKEEMRKEKAKERRRRQRKVNTVLVLHAVWILVS